MGFLNSARVEGLFSHCFLTKAEESANVRKIVAGSFAFKAKFHAERIEASRRTIKKLLAELPDAFRSKNGAAFELACNDRHGVRWAREGEFWEEDVETLLSLAIAIGEVEKCDLPLHMSWLEYPTYFKLK